MTPPPDASVAVVLWAIDCGENRVRGIKDIPRGANKATVRRELMPEPDRIQVLDEESGYWFPLEEMLDEQG